MPRGTLPDIPDEPTGDTSGMPNIPPPRRRLRRRRDENASSTPVQQPGPPNNQIDTPTREPVSSNSSSSGQ